MDGNGSYSCVTMCLSSDKTVDKCCRIALAIGTECTKRSWLWVCLPRLMKRLVPIVGWWSKGVMKWAWEDLIRMPLGVLWRWLRDAWVPGEREELTVGCACSRRAVSTTWWISSGFAPNELMCGVLSDSMRDLPNSIDEAWEFFLALLVKQWRRHRRVWLLSQRVLPNSAGEAIDGSLVRSVRDLDHRWVDVSDS